MLWSYWVFRWRYIWIYMKITLVSNSRFDLRYLSSTYCNFFFLNIDTYAFSMCSLFFLHFSFILLFFLLSLLPLVDHNVRSWPWVVFFSSIFRLTVILNLQQIWFAHCLLKKKKIFTYSSGFVTKWSVPFNNVRMKEAYIV